MAETSEIVYASRSRRGRLEARGCRARLQQASPPQLLHEQCLFKKLISLCCWWQCLPEETTTMRQILLLLVGGAYLKKFTSTVCIYIYTR